MTEAVKGVLPGEQYKPETVEKGQAISLFGITLPKRAGFSRQQVHRLRIDMRMIHGFATLACQSFEQSTL